MVVQRSDPFAELKKAKEARAEEEQPSGEPLVEEEIAALVVQQDDSETEQATRAPARPRSYERKRGPEPPPQILDLSGTIQYHNNIPAALFNRIENIRYHKPGNLTKKQVLVKALTMYCEAEEQENGGIYPQRPEEM